MALLTVMLGVTFGLVLHFTQQSLEAESLRTLDALANNAETAYSPGLDDGTRVPYFALEINARGDIITTRGGYFDLSDREKLQKLIDIAVNSEDDIGEVPDYGLRFYRVVTRTSWRVVFADTSAETTTLHSLIRTLAIASAAALAVFFVMSLLLARWLVRPVARAWDQQRQFVADASHELKTPLTVILTNAELLQAPNNILAVEYLKAIFDQRLDLHPLTILRPGAPHDRPAEGNVRSASELRTRIGAGENVSAFLPKAAAEISAREKTLGRGPVLPDALESALLSRLRMLPQAVYNALPGASEGLGNSLYRAAHEAPTLDGVLAAAKSKRYALSRIRRMTMCAALGVTAGMDTGTPPYARVLAIGAQGRELLRAIDARTSVPVITKPAAGRSLPGSAGEIFALTADAHDLYVLGCPAREERRCGGDWRASPFVL